MKSLQWDTDNDDNSDDDTGEATTVSLNDGQIQTVQLRGTVGDDANETLDHEIGATSSAEFTDPDPSTANATISANLEPTISSFSATNPDSQDIEVSFDSDEQLSTISVDISTAESATLTADDFSKEWGNGDFTYTATYEGSTDGQYDVTLSTAADSEGADVASGEFDAVHIYNVPTSDRSADTTHSNPVSADDSPPIRGPDA